MRELKFRAWEIEDKKYYPVIKLWFDSTVGKPDSAELWLSKNETEIADIPEQIELEQYTGLKDKNGKEIYEGDIMSDKSVVRFAYDDEVGSCGCCVDKFWGSGFIISNNEPIELIEVIGNIHDNPELLKGE